MCGDVDHSGALIEAGITEADAIIIGPADDLPDNEVAPCLVSWHFVCGRHVSHAVYGATSASRSALPGK